MSTEFQQFDDEIDLRELVATLLAHWKIIAAATIACAFLGLAAGLLGKSYAASAYVVVDTNGMQDDYLDLPSEAIILDLARSDSTLQAVLARLGEEELDGVELDLEKLWSATSVSYSERSLHLTVEYSESELAVLLVNTWAQVAQETLAEHLGPSEELLQQVSENVTRAGENWQAAQEAYIDFRFNSDISSLEVLASALQQELADYYAADARLEQVQQDAENLLGRIRQGDMANQSDQPVTLSSLQNEIWVLLLAPNLMVSTSMTAVDPLVLEFSIGTGIELSAVENQIADLELFINTLSLRRSDLASSLAETENEQLRVERALLDQLQQEELLLAKLETSREVYVDGLILEQGAQNTHLLYPNSVTIVSSAAITEEAGIGGMQSLALAAMIGAIGAAMLVLITSWWKKC